MSDTAAEQDYGIDAFVSAINAELQDALGDVGLDEAEAVLIREGAKESSVSVIEKAHEKAAFFAQYVYALREMSGVARRVGLAPSVLHNVLFDLDLICDGSAATGNKADNIGDLLISYTYRLSHLSR